MAETLPGQAGASSQQQSTAGAQSRKRSAELPQRKGYCLASHGALTQGLSMLLVEAGPTKIRLQ